MGILNIKPLSRVSKIIFSGLFILILYSIIASLVYVILQNEINLPPENNISIKGIMKEEGL
jgi:ABC-type iron transport system FetAB permease component